MLDPLQVHWGGVRCARERERERAFSLNAPTCPSRPAAQLKTACGCWGFRVEGVGAQSSGYRGSGFRVARFGVKVSEFRVSGFGVQGVGVEVQDSGCLGSGLSVSGFSV
eukprot:353104-Chlamydomonas_euryale.AAC.5